MSIRSELLVSSFKGVTFLEKSVTPVKGRKTAKHDYVKSDQRNVEDLGLKVPDYRVRCILDTASASDYFIVRERFENAINSPGAGILQLQTIGQINAQVSTVSRKESQDNLGVIEYDILFHQTNDDIIPSITVNPLQSATILKDQGFLDIASSFGNQFSATFSENISAARASLREFSQSISDSINTANIQASNVAQLNTLISDFNDQVTRLTQTPSALGTEMTRLYNNVLNFSGSNNDAIDAAFTSFNFNSGTTEPVITAATQQANANNTAIQNSNTAMGLFTIYQRAVNNTYADVSELNDLNDRVEEVYQGLIQQDIGSSVRNGLEEIRNTFQTFYEQQSIILPRLKTINTSRILASKLSYMLYGTTTHTDTLLNINGVFNDTYLEGNILVLTGVSDD